MHGLRNFHAGDIEQGRRDIHVQHHMCIIDGTGRDAIRPAHEHGHADRRLVHQALVKKAELAKKEAVVRGVDHDRVIDQLRLIDEGQNPTNVLVDAS